MHNTGNYYPSGSKHCAEHCVLKMVETFGNCGHWMDLYESEVFLSLLWFLFGRLSEELWKPSFCAHQCLLANEKSVIHSWCHKYWVKLCDLTVQAANVECRSSFCSLLHKHWLQMMSTRWQHSWMFWLQFCSMQKCQHTDLTTLMRFLCAHHLFICVRKLQLWIYPLVLSFSLLCVFVWQSCSYLCSEGERNLSLGFSCHSDPE